MKSEDIRNIFEAYNSIYEGLVDPAELENLRKASAQATMAGPSKEAQALMSDRTKRMLGPEKLAAGIKAQQEVEKMKSEIGVPKPALTPTAPVLPVPTTSTQTPKPPTTPTQTPKAPVPDRSSDYQRAWDNRNNPFAKGRIRDAWSKMSPEERAAAKEWAKANNKNWQEMNLPEQRDFYDEVLEYLLSEGCTLNESNYIMTYIVEQGMPPQEIIGRGIANLLGLDRPHPTEIFARGLKKMLYPNKPVEVKAPKPPAIKPVSTAPKPNPYRSGATIRATGPNLDKFPELQRFADQGRRIAEPVAKTASALTALGRLGRLGVAGAVMAPRPTGDATLTAAMQRGDVAPPAPKLPAPEKPKPVVRTVAQKPTVSKPKPVIASKPVSKPEAKGPQWPTLTPPPPVEKKPSLADTVKDIRGAIERSKERQKMDANK